MANDIDTATDGVSRAGKPGLHLPQRFIPAPASVSPEARAALSMSNPYAGSPEPDPSDKQAWAERQRASEEQLTAMVAPMAAAAPPRSVTERALDHCVMYEIEPTTLSDRTAGKVLFYVHGGAFVTGGGIAASHVACPLAMQSGLRTFSVDYRMPPGAPFPAGLDDCVEAYRRLVETYGASNIAAYGPSAGGGLVASCLLKARDIGLPLPSCCVMQTPEADLTESGDSFETNMGLDPVLQRRLTNSIALYADGHDLRDPYLSPLFGDYSKGFAPTLVIAGTRDLFLSNAVLMHRVLKRAGIGCELSIWEAMGHTGFFGTAPEDAERDAETVTFMLSHLKVL